METFNERLAGLRKELGYDRKAEFAEAIGIERSTYDKLEKGPHSPSADNLAKIVKKFPHANLDWLLLGTGPMLRHGRALAPADAPAPDPPTPGLTSGAATVAEAENVLLRHQNTHLEAEVAKLWDMLGKPGSGHNATSAAPTRPRKPAPIGFRLSVSERVRGRGTVCPL